MKIAFFRLVSIIVVLFAFFYETAANAVPSFARQTGVVCSACHTVFPELTPFGRSFKAQGYTLSSSVATGSKRLEEDLVVPLSAMIQTTLTRSSKAQPGSQNNNTLLPEQFSLFYSGRISDKLGSFLQLTYEGAEDHFSLDNTDIRFANEARGKVDVTYGATLNNNPGAQDLWNSTPAWGFPYASAGVAPAPAASTVIDGTLGQQVAGLGVFAYFRSLLYAELSVYRAAQIGADQPPGSSSTNVLKNNAPYWRLALTRNAGAHSWEVGTYGIIADLYPSGVSGSTDSFRDTAIDGQYQFISDPHIVSAHGTYIWEKREWDASFAAGDTEKHSEDLHTFKADIGYYYKRLVGATLGYFSTAGDRDTILFAPEPVEGSRTGEPDSTGVIAEVDYFPWFNTRFSAQYVLYNKFNGASTNYDGSGRDASDNNTIYINAWLMY